MLTLQAKLNEIQTEKEENGCHNDINIIAEESQVDAEIHEILNELLENQIFWDNIIRRNEIKNPPELKVVETTKD